MISIEHKLVTKFHRELATEQWLKQLGRFVTERVASHPSYLCTDGHGYVSSSFGGDRDLVPNSYYSYRFGVFVAVERPNALSITLSPKARRDKLVLMEGLPHKFFKYYDPPGLPTSWGVSSDRYIAMVSYNPRNGEFNCGLEMIRTREIMVRYRYNRRQLKCMASLIESGYSLNQLASLHCPWCHGSLDVCFYPKGDKFVLYCYSNGVCEAHISQRPRTLPEWWTEKIGWIDEVTE